MSIKDLKPGDIVTYQINGGAIRGSLLRRSSTSSNGWIADMSPAYSNQSFIGDEDVNASALYTPNPFDLEALDA